MRMEQMGRAATIALILAALVVTIGCAASRRTQSRVNVLTAENVDLVQQSRTMQQQARDAQLAQDRTLLELQKKRHEAVQLETEVATNQQRAMAGDQAVAELRRSQEDNARNYERLQGLTAKVERVQRMRAVPKPAPVAPPRDISRPSAHIDAFATDLRGKLRAAGITLPVEMRTTRDGQRRVAVVLTDAFPSGKDSLAYNMDAVRAVVGVGQLISRSYPGSAVSVEGHTDSDPIKVSAWRSNEHLSLARAQSVKNLVSKSGVRDDLIETIGHGSRYPLESGSTKRAKSQNRRVEIYIEPRT